MRSAECLKVEHIESLLKGRGPQAKHGGLQEQISAASLPTLQKLLHEEGGLTARWLVERGAFLSFLLKHPLVMLAKKLFLEKLKQIVLIILGFLKAGSSLQSCGVVVGEEFFKCC